MTFEKYFVAVRHESELLTPPIQSPVLNFSLREMAYLRVFGLSAVFAVIGAIPIFFAVGASPFLVRTFLRISGEIPEMYLYYAIISVLQPKKRARKAKSPKKNKKDGHQTSDIMGFGHIVAAITINTKNPRLQMRRFKACSLQAITPPSRLHWRLDPTTDTRQLQCSSTGRRYCTIRQTVQDR